MMLFRRLAIAILVIGFGGQAMTVAGDTIESVEKTLIERAAKITSLQFNMTSTSDFESQGYRFKQDSKGQYEYLLKGDKMLYRMESKARSVTVQGGKEETSNTVTTMVCDGEFLYMLNDADGQKTVMKQDPTNQAWVTNQAYFDNLRRYHDLNQLPDETVDGKSTYVIECTPKDEISGGAPKTIMIMYFDKKTGIGIKTIGKDSTGKVVSTGLTTDVKINSDISADRFVFKAPEGVQVLDMTSAAQAQGQPDQPAEAAEDEPEKAEEESAKAAPEEAKKDKKKKKGGLFDKLRKKKRP